MNGAVWPLLRRGCLLIVCLAMGSPGAACAQSCDTTAIGVDLAQADTYVQPFYCRGWGEVFLATDTLIHSISVWRPAQPDSDAFARYLFIAETKYFNTVGNPSYPPDSGYIPDMTRRLLSAPPLVHQVGDGVHPVEYRWVFDPPFALPHRGRFFFDIMADRWSGFLMPASSTNPYPDGDAWKTSPSGGDCPYPAGAFYKPPPRPDMAFQIQFCTTGVTGVPPPGDYALTLAAAPNPFRHDLGVSFDLPSSTLVQVRIFDLAGRSVATLVDGVLEAGPHWTTWNGRGASGSRVTPGVYFLRLQTAGHRLSRTVVLIE